MSEQASVKARLIGSIFVEKGLITDLQLEHALELQRESGSRLGEVLVAHFGLSRVELASVLAEQWAEHERAGRQAEADQAAQGDNGPAPQVKAVAPEDIDYTDPVDRRPIGEIFVERGFVTELQLEQALDVQKQTGERLGEILVATGSLTRLDLAGALAEQWSSLQKLRPPAPKPSVAWQQAAPEQAVAADAAARTELEEVRRSLVGVEDRLRLAESALIREPWKDEVRTAVEGASLRLDVLEGRLADVVSREELADVGMLAASLTELRAVVEEMRGRADSATVELNGMREVVSLLPTHDHLAVRIDEAVSGVVHRVQSLEGRPTGIEEIAQARAEIAATTARVESLSEVDASLSSLIEDLSAKLATAIGQAREGSVALESRLEQVAGFGETAGARLEELSARTAETANAMSLLRARVDMLPAGFDAAQLETSVAGLQARVDELASTLPQDLDTRLLQLDQLAAEARATTARLEAQLTVDGSAVQQVAARLEETAGMLAELRLRLDGVTAGVDAEQLDRVIAELESRFAQAAAPTDTAERLAEVAERVEAAHGQLQHRIDEIAAAGEAGASAVREDYTELRERVTALQEMLEQQPAPPADVVEGAVLQSLEQDLRDRLKSMRDDLAARAEETAGRQSELAGELVVLAGRLDEIVAAQAQLVVPDSFQEAVAALRTEVAEKVDAVGRHNGDDFAALAGRVDGLFVELRQLTEPGSYQPPDLEPLRAELATLVEQATSAHTEHVAAIEARVGELLVAREEAYSRQEAQGDFAAVVARIDALAGKIEQLDALTTPEVDLEPLRAELTDLVERTSARHAEHLAALETRLGEAVAGSQSMYSRPEAETDFAAIRGLIHDMAAVSSEQRATELAALGARVEEIALALESGTGSDHAGVAVEALRAELSTTLETRIGQQASDLAALRYELEALPRNVDGEWRAALDNYVGELTEQVSARTGLSEATTSRLEAELTAVRDGLVEAAAARATESEATAAALAALAARLDSLPNGADERLLEALQHEHAKLTYRVDGILAGAAGSADRVAAHDDVLHGIEARISSLEEAARTAVSSLRAEFEEHIAALGKAGDAGTTDDEPAPEDEKLASRVEKLERRLGREAARAEEQARVTEKALRKGLAALGEKLTKSERSYEKAGNALRDSIDRLGYALVDADARIAERASETMEDFRSETEPSFVAFVPSDGGYRLVVVDDRPPALGEKVRIDGVERKLVVTRITRSPLPLDSRPCVYLEASGKKS